MEARALIAREATSAYARTNGRSITSAAFCADIMTCAESLPVADHVINLCADRYQFSVGFFAAAVRGQVNLLPTKRDHNHIEALRRDFSNVCVLADVEHQPSVGHPTPQPDHLLDLQPGQQGTVSSPTLDSEALVAIAFTSGSTGQPQAHPKSWALLDEGRRAHASQLAATVGSPDAATKGLVATVPSWHMYGLEWALLLPTTAPLELYCGNDFFPHDVHSALQSYQQDSILVSTPLHLRALLKTPAPSKPVAVTVCATAPLDVTLAQQLEQHLQTRLLEIYGCSEIGSLAARATASEIGWRFFDAFDLDLQAQTLTVGTPLLPKPIALGDQFAETADGRFELLGRATDLIKVAGKRESLAHLNHLAQSIAGVEDAVFYQPEQLGLPDNGRLGLLIVAPNVSAATLKRELARRLDHAFMPRPMHRVEALPREPSSKLTHTALAALVARINQSNP